MAKTSTHTLVLNVLSCKMTLWYRRAFCSCSGYAQAMHLMRFCSSVWNLMKHLSFWSCVTSSWASFKPVVSSSAFLLIPRTYRTTCKHRPGQGQVIRGLMSKICLGFAGRRGRRSTDVIMETARWTPFGTTLLSSHLQCPRRLKLNP